MISYRFVPISNQKGVLVLRHPVYILPFRKMLFCCSSSFHSVFTYKFIRYPSSQASADPTSDVCIVAYSFSIYFFYVVPNCFPIAFKRK